MTPSTFCSASVGLPSGFAFGAGGFVPRAKVTLRSPGASAGPDAGGGGSAGAGAACAEGEMKVGKGEGNWKK